MTNGSSNSGKGIRMDIKGNMVLATIIAIAIGITVIEIGATDNAHTAMSMVRTTIALLDQWFGEVASIITWNCKFEAIGLTRENVRVHRQSTRGPISRVHYREPKLRFLSEKTQDEEK